jgi:hypothetical protein
MIDRHIRTNKRFTLDEIHEKFPQISRSVNFNRTDILCIQKSNYCSHFTLEPTAVSQQQITTLLRVVAERPTPSIFQEEAPFKNTRMVLEITKIWSRVPTGPETKNDCAGEGQQQITALLSSPRYHNPKHINVSVTTEPSSNKARAVWQIVNHCEYL